jgi:hypothetical protein
MTAIDAIPSVALALSIIGLVLSVLNYTRDRARVRAWAEIYWYARGATPDSSTPRLLLRVANLGRRPVVLLRLGLFGEGQRWYLNLKEPKMRGEVTVDKTIEALDRHTLAQNSAVRLPEGENFDIGFWPSESDKFIFTRADPIVIAQRIYVEDCAGRRYRVKNDVRCIHQLLDGERPN